MCQMVPNLMSDGDTYCVQFRMSLINSDFSFEHRKLGFYEITDTTQMKHFTKKEKRAEQRGSLKFPRI